MEGTITGQTRVMDGDGTGDAAEGFFGECLMSSVTRDLVTANGSITSLVSNF